jgi:hypothetical protein
MLLYFFAGAPIWMSLGFLAGAGFAYITRKELFAAWHSLALHSSALLSKCEADAENLKDQDLAALRDAIRLLEELGALPSPLPRDAAACSAEDA